MSRRPVQTISEISIELKRHKDHKTKLRTAPAQLPRMILNQSLDDTLEHWRKNFKVYIYIDDAITSVPKCDSTTQETSVQMVPDSKCVDQGKSISVQIREHEIAAPYGKG